ncbi:conserved Plasmodium protein, unknown function [Plasmodium knowlesi strain H]|uniref:Uncharacterized protein n=3 Tax=Plasmodium knowlesi TaxID=5850 RepID=A0A5K1V1U7_PLAKH|nr:conserved Plasmodium protein, unknown function [Plasmodium knowlesi strain H]OTN68273.1 Uncharacterized protein PKNOH_S03320200 [Plasmodium knowlesi]CAA9987104.1 conserved Plasmodium protein, unknown function [Plasmodium knowlesi strain H]SBO23843.1 conserved Plasmodium protein, unknown function [Plasmodium knowlesi strain H]SBO25639.1 conserved Plasmodium protein, unknown function [Plasmodium knowlesi strain H]VVS76578.1 conserved Plasmodium protein, unknown function [Plasmodium knowlesi s|eukprot:XP_002261726.1 hypothetical protein, conserved in Plasmodium species [Plasmodium knowlesi strain H]
MEADGNILEKSRELSDILIKSFKNEVGSVNYLNECRNRDCSEFYGAFYLVYSDLIEKDKNLSVFKDHLVFLSFCYMNKLLAKHYQVYPQESKVSIRNSFINILFCLPINYNHVLDGNTLHVKEKSVEALKKRFVDDFLNPNNILMADYLNERDNYFIRSYINCTKNKMSQIFSHLCMNNEYFYFRYFYNFFLFFVKEFLRRKLSLQGGVVDGSCDASSSGTDGAYFSTVVHICLNFLREIFYNISNENSKNVQNKQQLNTFRGLIINEANELFEFLSICFYYSLSCRKKGEFELLIECVKELFFFFPVHLFFNHRGGSNSPLKFLLNLLFVCFAGNGNAAQNNAVASGVVTSSGEGGDYPPLQLNEFNALYNSYLSVNDLSCVSLGVQSFLSKLQLQENLLLICLNIMEYISRINGKTFIQLDESELMQFLESYFNISLNVFDVTSYSYQKLYIRMILNLSSTPISNYLHDKKNKKKCLHMYIINVFKNIYHPDVEILANVLAICKNIFEHNRELIYIKNRDSEIDSQKYNIHRMDREGMLDQNNEKVFNQDIQFVLNIEDLKKLFILMFVRFIKIPLHSEQNSLNRKMMINFVQNFINEYNEEWFQTYFRYVKDECMEGDKGEGGMTTSDKSGHSDYTKNALKQRIFVLFRVLVGLNHEVFSIMVEVFCHFFRFYKNITVENLCNESIKVKDYFLYVLLRGYCELLTFFLNTLKECKSMVTGGDTEVNEEVISFQALPPGEKEAYLQGIMNLRDSLSKRIIGKSSYEETEMDKKMQGMVNWKGMNTDWGSSNQEEENIEELKKRKEKVDLQIHIISCIQKYGGSPYYEVSPDCINNLLNCYKEILNGDFINMCKISPGLILFEVKRLQFLSDSTYLLHYNKECAFYMMENLLRNIIQGETNGSTEGPDENTSMELKKNYFTIFTSIISNLQHLVTNDMLEKMLNSFIQFKTNSSVFKCNKELCIFLLTVISVLKVDDLNGKVINSYLRVVLEELFVFLSDIAKNMPTFGNLYEFLFGDERKVDIGRIFLDVLKIAQTYFSVFSFPKVESRLRGVDKNGGDGHVDGTEKTILENERLVQNNAFLQISMELFTRVMFVYPVMNEMSRNCRSFEAHPMLCAEVSYFHLNMREREIASLCTRVGKEGKSGKKFSLTLKSVHENMCTVVKRFISEGYIFLYNDMEKLFLEVLSPAFDYGPYHFMGQNVQHVYLCLSERLRQNLAERTMKELEANWCEHIFAQFVLKHYTYFKASLEHIQMVNEHLNRQDDIKEEDYVMYSDLLYHSKHYIFTFLKICKNVFTLPNEFKNNQDGKSFFCRFYQDDKNETLNNLFLNLELLLHSYDCNIVKKSLSLFLDISDSITLLPFESSHFLIYLGMLKLIFRSFILFNPPILTLQQKGKDGGEVVNNCNLLKRYEENNPGGRGGGSGGPHGYLYNESFEVYTGEMNLFMKNDPQELTSYLYVIPSAFIKICKNYFSLQEKVYRLKESGSTSLDELLQLDSVKHFLFLFKDVEGSSPFDFRTIVADLFQQNACDYLRSALVQCRLRAQG